MADLVITEVEIAKELPSWQGKGAKVFRYTIEGDSRRPEDFVPNDREPKKVGETIPGIEDSEYGPKVKRAEKASGGAFKKSPEQELRIVRQHSQEQACRVQAVLGRVLSESEFQNLINWFVADAYRKDKGQTNAWPATSDLPFDDNGMDITQSDQEAFQT